MSRLPIDILDVICQDDARDRGATWQCNLEGVTLHLTCDRTGNSEASPGVVGARRQDQRWPTAALLMSGLRIERQPNQIASVRDVGARYHTS